MADKNIRAIDEVGQFINDYYKDSDELLERVL